MGNTALVVTASVQQEKSVTRMLVNDLIRHLTAKGEIDTVIERDLSDNQTQLITGAHVGAFYTPPAERNDAQNALLTQSDQYLNELKQAQVLIIGSPMYNFSVPGVLKAWIDQICRVGETFKYTPSGPVGLLNIETAYLVVATGGSAVNSDLDFLVPYLTRIAHFIGVKNVKVVAADKMNRDREAGLALARAQVAAMG